MPSISAFHHLSLTVTDLARSTRWYTEVLGFGLHSEVQGETFQRNRLRHPDAGITVTLTRHDRATSEPFDETRTGLDHVAFLVPTVAEIAEWKARFEEHGVVHSEVSERPGSVATIAFRDPDNIQLEVMAIGT